MLTPLLLSHYGMGRLHVNGVFDSGIDAESPTTTVKCATTALR
jgi:hypothetical protein